MLYTSEPQFVPNKAEYEIWIFVSRLFAFNLRQTGICASGDVETVQSNDDSFREAVRRIVLPHSNSSSLTVIVHMY